MTRFSIKSIPGMALLFYLISLSLGSLSTAETLEIDGNTFQLIGDARHDHYVFSIALAAPSEKAELIFACSGTTDYYSFRLDNGNGTLESNHGGTRTVLDKRPVALADEANIEIRRQPHSVSVLVNGRYASWAANNRFFRGKLLTRAGSTNHIQKVRYQPLSGISFRDDFMGTNESVKDLGQWNVALGEWQRHSILEQVRERKFANVRPGNQPEAQRSANPFSLSSLIPENSLVTAGHWFWEDYRTEVSAKTDGGEVGLVAGYRGPENYFLLRYALLLDMRHPGKLELIQRSPKGEESLGIRYVKGRAGNWYRLQLAIRGGRVIAGVDDTQLFSSERPDAVGGKVGLYSTKARAYFDDFLVESDPSLTLDTKKLLESCTRTTSGDWNIVKDQDAWILEGTDGTRYLDESWTGGNCELSVQAIGNNDSVAIQVGDTVLQLNTDTSGKLQGRTSTQDVHARLQPGQWRRLFLNHKNNELRIILDGQLVARQVPAGAGKLAITSHGKCRYRDLTLFGSYERDIEKKVRRSIFSQDPYMAGWASPRWEWWPAGQSQSRRLPATYIYKGDIYGDIRVDMPIVGDATYFFGADATEPGEGYELRISTNTAKKSCKLALYRKQRLLKQAIRKVRPKTKKKKLGRKEETNWGKLELNVAGNLIWVTLNNEELLSVNEPEPSKGVTLGTVLHSHTDFAKVQVLRDQVKDYMFEQAPADWERVGTWEVINRFSCDPRWSHMNGRSKGLAALWNKHEFEGDFTIECFAGMRMRQELREGAGGIYPRVGDINLSFCGDGQNMFSGYALVLAAWDPYWSEKQSLIYRKNIVVAQTEREMIPRVRDGRPRARVIKVPWDPGGRPVHGAWYFLKLRRRENRIGFFFDNVKVMSFEDEEPPPGKHIALWTQNNSIVVARAKISYEKAIKPKARVSLRSEPDSLIDKASTETYPIEITSLTHPFLEQSFDKHFTDWSVTDSEQSALLSIDKEIKAEGAGSLKLVNKHPGGDSGVVAPVQDLDVSKIVALSFDYRIPSGVLVNLYFQLKGKDGFYFIRLTGSGRTSAKERMAGDFNAVADGNWHTARIHLGLAMKERFPENAQLTLQAMRLGQFHEGYIQAGFGGNMAGAAYHIDNFRLEAAGGPDLDLTARTESKDVQEFCYILDNSPKTQPISAKGSLKVLPDKTQALGKDCKSLRVQQKGLTPGNWFFHVSMKTQNGKWTPPVHYPLLVSGPLKMLRTKPKDGAKWGGGEVKIFFEKDSIIDPLLSTVSVVIKHQELAPGNLDYDARHRVLRFNLENTSVDLKKDEEVSLEISFADTLLPAALRTPTKWWRTSQRKRKVNKELYRNFPLTLIFDPSLDKTPPSPVRLEARILDEDFEEGFGKILPYAQRGITLKRQEQEGRQFLNIINEQLAGYSGILLHRGQFNLGRYPFLTFDYRTDGNLKADFQFQTRGGNKYMGFTDSDDGLEFVGKIDVVADKRWHRAEVDLRKVVGVYLRNFELNASTISQFVLGDFGHRGNVPGANLQLDNFSLVQAVSSNGGLRLRWGAEDISGIGGYSYSWSKRATDDPDTKVDSTEPYSTFEDLPEGDLFFHVRAQDTVGNWGRATHIRYLVDNTPPRLEEVFPAQGSKTASPEIKLHFHEKGSGIDPRSIQLKLNGLPVSLESEHTEFDAETGVLTYDWAGAGLFPDPDDKSRLSFELDPAKDFAGNGSEPASWSWVLDFKKDQDGPVDLAIEGEGNLVQSFTSFTQDFGDWKPLGQSGARIAISRDEDRQDNCLKATIADTWDESGVYLQLKKNVPVAPNPIVAFDYKFPPGLRILLRVYANSKYRCISLTQDPDGYDKIGEIPGIVADGKWHHAIFNLHDILKDADPETKAHTVGQFAFGNWSNLWNAKGSEYYIDNFILTGSGTPEPRFSVHATDPSGIAGLAWTLDSSSASMPAPKIRSAAGLVKLPVAKKTGLRFFSVRARDKAGNWGPAHRYPFYTDAAAPNKRDGLESKPNWTAQAEDKPDRPPQLRSLPSAAGGKVLSVTHSFQSRKNRELMLSLKRSVPRGRNKRLSFHLFHQGEEVTCRVLLSTSSRTLVSRPQSVPGGQWSTPVSFDLTGRRFTERGDSGRYTSVLGSKEAIKEIHLKFECADKKADFLIDALYIR